LFDISSQSNIGENGEIKSEKKSTLNYDQISKLHHCYDSCVLTCGIINEFENLDDG